MTRLLALVIVLTLFAGSEAWARQSTGFFRVDSRRVVDASGQPAMKRGIGLGGWLMPEGYMLHVPGYGSPTSMRNQIRDLIGEADAATFWELYTEHYVAEKDIAALAAAGFDHIRLPFHYDLLYDLPTRSFKPEGFALIDTFIEWCRTYGLYVILDLHAAPGAQNEGNISDSDGQARLWTQPGLYQGITVDLWTGIAQRYRDETQIIGYDLINEPVVTDQMVADPPGALRALYEKLAEAVRSVDTNHILFIEGNYWATTFDKLAPPFDDQMVYAFHKYWNAPDLGSIGYLLALRNTWTVPLWLGETGENSNVWFHEVVKLMEGVEIGWNWWTHKKIQSTTSPWSAPLKPGYRAVLDYWAGSGPRPSASAARDALFDMARSLDLDSTRFDPDVLRALMDPTFGTSRRPYAEHVIPGVVNAVDYDSGMPGKTYEDEDVWAISGSPGGGNRGGRYRNDGVDIEASSDAFGHPFNVGWMEPGEWMEYTVWVERSGTYRAEFRMASPNGGGTLEVRVDGAPVATVTAPRTGGWQTWGTATVPSMHLDRGQHVLRLTVGSTGSFNLNRAIFALVEADPGEEIQDAPEFWPNPVDTELRLLLPEDALGPVRVGFFDAAGRERLSGGWEEDGSVRIHTVDVSGLPAGLYLVRIEAGGRVHHGTVIVAR